MNEIKFRIWCSATKEFFYFDSLTDLINSILIDISMQKVLVENCQNLTTQLATGLVDYYGREIYEGDILISLINNESTTIKGVCKRLIGAWKICPLENLHIAWHGWKQSIIGNIFQNPELLKEHY